MIAYLSGKIIAKFEKATILDTGKIGYLVNLNTAALEKLENGQETELYIHTNVREDDISLFGFQSLDELNFFKKLINIPGIGPKTAMEILNVPLDKLKAAIFHEDVAALTKIPGIGKKSAERIVLEMKNKVSMEDLVDREYQGLGKKIDNDAMEALMKLGYDRYTITKTFKDLPKEISTSEEIIKFFLQHQ